MIFQHLSLFLNTIPAITFQIRYIPQPLLSASYNHLLPPLAHHCRCLSSFSRASTPPQNVQIHRRIQTNPVPDLQGRSPPKPRRPQQAHGLLYRLIHWKLALRRENLQFHGRSIFVVYNVISRPSRSTVFDEMPEGDSVSWNVLISGYVTCNRFEDAIDVFQRMQWESNAKPNEATFVSTLSACTALKILKLARQILDAMPMKNVICWTSMVSGYVNCGRLDEAREFNCVDEAVALFREMQSERIKPDKFTVVALLTGGSQLGALEQGKWIHGYIEENRIAIDVVVGTALIDMYSKCGCIDKSLEIFRRLKEKYKNDGIMDFNYLRASHEWAEHQSTGFILRNETMSHDCLYRVITGFLCSQPTLFRIQVGNYNHLVKACLPYAFAIRSGVGARNNIPSHGSIIAVKLDNEEGPIGG
ncbi:pentatricopeptide repeat (PPR-like) superfamily protein [Actinidia rufa]|uniref:Pentatricopeptide repeat (PPR-like) superfamily protein n=1 Tax=Actinidia rufa TaxID=165716 RepID=A0A7J0FIN3_9ERIC|nr:pentatricopeptide repeat (PPR-like) superfamily protein [Actinidia rufa]